MLALGSKTRPYNALSFSTHGAQTCMRPVCALPLSGRIIMLPYVNINAFQV